MTATPTYRSLSIDAYRALVMVLMIFVNDTWTLIAIPDWIGHLPAAADGLGLADVVFPVFLFIVGLSIPFAIQHRLNKGDSRWQIAMHIAVRSLALVIMGFFHVNFGDYAGTLLPKWIWQVLVTIGFFLVWLDYPDPKSAGAKALKLLGIVGLVALAWLFRSEGHPEAWFAMRPQWWGILGLIGWSYLLVALAFLVTKGRFWGQLALFAGFVLFNMGAQSGLFAALSGVKAHVWIVGDGSLPALATSGVLVSLGYQRYRADLGAFLWRAALAALVLVALGLVARLEWNISKIWATPSFTLVCAGIGTAGFASLVYIVDVRQWVGWYRFIKPAGSSTLTCYLLPYIHYAVLAVVGWQLPEWFRTGGIGILKSLGYALLIVSITGILEKYRVRLKL